MSNYKKEPIAIVGTAYRFPGNSNSPSRLWDLLRNPRDIVSDISKERLNLSSFYNRNGEHHGSTDVKGKSYMLSEDIRDFDPSFFNINPREAEALDPQQRILLETVYEALENAGCPLDEIQGTQTSVYVGLMTADWQDVQFRDPETMPTYAATGTARSILSNRVSYFFDLHGPSMTIDTACSSSLVALDQAVQSLRKGHSSSAIVAGANLLIDPCTFISESSVHMVSPNAHSRMWDKDADGYARGEGFAAMLLKPLGRALEDGDQIEAIIRETGVNSDGRTTGITMPSSDAQASLIRQTYRNAGLDPVRDRCQYFECHGTGTQAGDPVEARAVKHALFPAQGETGGKEQPILYTGSIKTVIGHLEGCAGLAGIIKASLALKHRIIPPNLHFHELNPKIEPFYDGLCVPTRAIPWPETGGGPRRASVNSFGFGGTNAHAIVESYESHDASSFACDDQLPGATTMNSLEERFSGPLVFSAHSESSLKRVVRDFVEYLRKNPNLSLRDLTWVLDRRRSPLPVKAFFSGATRQKLLDSMSRTIQQFDDDRGSELLYRHRLLYPTEVPGILGVFTGQGAQWATMGTALLRHSPIFQESIRKQQASLDRLPDGPSWSIAEQLLASKEDSRIGEAEFSQPLSTALQVGLVDIMAAAGVHLDAVVGHSSGEIAAVYAAGMISAEDAVRIAYYRGVHTELACGADGQSGGMMAVGLSMENAREFCSQGRFKGRISVAASNSGASVTLSGDLDAIQDAKAVFDEQKIFARQLTVDKAYHSHHMLRCADAYLASLGACNITVQAPRAGTTWISSVRGDPDLVDENRLESLTGQYWVDNMVRPVLFSRALERSFWCAGPFEIGIEVGPHPALKGPAMQVFKSSMGHAVPYAGLMRRGDDEVEGFAGCIGYVWQHLGPEFVDLDGLRRAFETNDQPPPRMLKELPTYSWDHTRPYWKESRISRQYRIGGSKAHELLGRRTPNSFEHEVSWRSIIRLDEIPWLRGHEFQGQTLFPAGGYLSMAVEAAKAIANDNQIRTIDIRDFELPKACVLKDGPEGVEMIFVLHREEATTNKDIISASFTCYTCHDEAIGHVERTCFGRLEIQLGQPIAHELPPRPITRKNMTPLAIDRFYDNIRHLGLNYQGCFKGLKSGVRTDKESHVTGSWQDNELGDDYTVHPAVLDVGFHSIFCAFASPATGELWAPYLPVGIRRLTVDPNVRFHGELGRVDVEAHGFIQDSTFNTLDAEVHMYNPDSGECGVAVEGITVRAMYQPDASNDRILFIKNDWDQDISSGLTMEQDRETEQESAAIEAAERVSLHYRQTLLAEIKPEERQKLPRHHRLFLSSSEQLIRRVQNDEDPYCQNAWLNDSREYIRSLKDAYPDCIDMQLATIIGEILPDVLRGSVQLPEIMVENDMLDRYRTEALGLERLNSYVAGAVTQITHRYPRPAILEISAGAGGVAKAILKAIGDKFSSYTYTDVSAVFFEKAGVRFEDQVDKMIFKTLDIEKETVSQGYQDNSYDIVVACNTFHATNSLEKTIENTRKLLRPGGFLILLETTGDMSRHGFVMGGLPEWWIGADEGRVLGPGVSPTRWDGLLQGAGFSGVQHVMYDTDDPIKHSCSMLVSQAVDETFELVHEPLSSTQTIEGPVVVITGRSLVAAKLARDIKGLLSRYTPQFRIIESVDSFAKADLPPNCSVIVLEELEKPLLMPPVSAARMHAVQKLFTSATNILWVTKGRLDDSPQSNLMVAVGRTLRNEIPSLNMQFLDFAQSAGTTGIACAEALLRLAFAATPEFQAHGALWTTEPEILVDNNVLLLPRVKSNDEANERYNAIRRNIWKEQDPSQTCMELAMVNGKLVLKECGPVPEALHIRVAYSTTLPSSETTGYHLCLGELSDNSGLAISVTNSVPSCITVSRNEVVVLPKYVPCESSTLRAITHHLIASCILAYLEELDAPVILFEPTDGIVNSIRNNSRSLPRIHFASCSSDAVSKGWMYLHPRATRHTMQSVIPQGVSSCIHFAGPLAHDIESRLSLLLDCRIVALERLLPGLDALRELLSVVATDTARETPSEVVEAMDIDMAVGTTSNSFSQGQIVQWPRHRKLKAALKTLDTSTLFKNDRSYLLVGLTGDMGQSLCRYMVRNGARHIALTSRNADPKAPWLQEMKDLGADVIIRRMDVTDRTSVRDTVTELRRTLPPIAGVCNGAMILADSMFENMSADEMNTALLPKVNGSTYLDELFVEPTLDFFVLFSSCAAVLGNPGQANYNAANLFMTGLASNRKRRGLAGSVIDIGMVTDVGVVVRQGMRIESLLRKNFWEPLSEKDVQQMFAEAILAGEPDFPGTGQISMGIKTFLDSPDAVSRPQWYSNPRFSHMIKEAPVVKDETSSSFGKAHVRQEIEEAESEKVATAAVVAAFSAKLELTLQLTAGTVRSDISLLDAGVDSLLAVEVRTWFLKEIHVDVPILRILSGVTIADLCAEAASKYLASKMDGAASIAPEEKPTITMPSKEDKSVAPPTAFGIRRSDLPLATPPSDSSRSSSPTRDFARESSVLRTTANSSKAITRSATPLTELDPDDRLPFQNRKPSEINFTRSEPMSSAQSRLWFMREFLEDQTTYNITIWYSINGPMCVKRFKNALESVFAQHEALRTCFYKETFSGRLMQGVRSDVSLNFSHKTTKDDSYKENVISSYKNHIWNIEDGKVFGATLITHDENRATIVFGYHHIALDGASWVVFLKDLTACYQREKLAPLRRQYIDFSREQNQAVTSGLYDSDLNFWRQEHATLLEDLPLLPFARVRSRKETTSYDSTTITYEISQNLAQAIKKTSQSCGVTPFHFHLAAIQVLFNKFIGVEKLCLGILDANRMNQDYATTVGFFLNLLPLQFQVCKNDAFVDIAKRTLKKVYSGLSHSSVPFDMVLDALNVPRSSAAPPLFQVAVNYRVGSMAEIPLGNSKMSYEDAEDAKNPYDLSWGISEFTGGKVLLQVTSRDYLYSPSDTQCIMNAYIHLVETFSKTPSRRVADCTLYRSQDIQQAIDVGQGTRVDYASDWPDTLTRRIEHITKLYPNEVAVRDGSGSTTYSELDEQVNSLAHSISDQDFEPGSRVAVLCQPSTASIRSILAIIKLGLVYVPLDLSLNLARHAAIIRACDPVLVLHDQSTAQAAKVLAHETNLELIDATDLRQESVVINSHASPHSPAFLLHTSGSTGVPKGIELTQAGYVNYFAGITDRLGVGREKVLQQSSLGFDLSLGQIFLALANGGTLVVVSQELRGDLVGITKLMLAEDITFIFACPTETMTMLHVGGQHLRQCESWRYALIGGEKVTEQLLESFQQLGLEQLRFVSAYGPTELSILAACQDVSISDPDSDARRMNAMGSLGHVLPNYSVFILDENHQPLPCGYPGEICVGGPGLALGYWNMPEETRDKFRTNPFASSGDRARGWTRMYCSSDKGKLLPDGQVIFLGRIEGDSQVKLRGMRIELEEISNALCTAAPQVIADAIVTVRGDPELLLAHVVFQHGKSLSQSELRQLVHDLPLPKYMHPSAIVPLEFLPRTNSGKADRRAIEYLPLPDIEQVSAAQDDLTMAEGELRLLWEEVLQIPAERGRLGPDSDFFMAGGNSLLLVQLKSTIQESMALDVPIRDMYSASTLRQMSARITHSKAAVPAQEIDWEEETRPDFSEISKSTKIEPRHISGPREVLLTGATSFLGSYILRVLLKDPTIKHVHAIAIDRSKQANLPTSLKLTAYPGTLYHPTLGLSALDLSKISSTIDFIMHAGAVGHCLNNYSSVRAPNYTSTRFLASLALKRGIPLHYLSSSRVALLSGQHAVAPISVAEQFPVNDGSEGFTVSKWASERFLEQLAARTGLEVCIHRACAPIGDRAPNEDALNALLLYSKRMRATPVFEGIEGFFDFEEVGTIAARIVAKTKIEDDEASSQRSSSSSSSTRFFHHSSGAKVPVDQLKGRMESLHGGSFEQLPAKEWIERSKALGIESLITSYLEAMVQKGKTIAFPFLGEGMGQETR